MAVADRLIDVLLVACEILDVLYFPGKHLRWGESTRFRGDVHRSLGYLRDHGLIERRRDASRWVYRLTEKGRQRLGGDLEPEKRWNRPWDGLWRQVVFDIPARQKAVRARLLYWFRANRFGYLQDSVWITPDPLDLSRSLFRSLHATADMAAFLESRVVAGSANADLVTCAWDFREVSRTYARYSRFVEGASSRLAEACSRNEVWPILLKEKRLWSAALQGDPLLPRLLWPKGYPGAAAFAARKRFLGRVRERAARI
ncbi:MAG: hypothetical protein IT578_00715 [Verrucomicrobiae bacterium]|nr:hypothetical protein [Verrucomicrobiae bacterium]